MSCKELPAYAHLDLDVVAAEGDELVLRDGRRVLDLYGGHCVNTLGAGNTELAAALADQWDALSFATNLLALDERERFLAAFGANLPDGAWQVFLSNSGAEANENALKGALGATGRGTIVCFEGAFHGRTAAASAVTDTTATGFPSAPFDVRRLPLGDVRAAEGAIDGDVAGVIIEPIQAMAGVVEPGAAFLGQLKDLCRDAGSLLIYDEVQTGNGRLGTPWAAQKLGVVPDVFTTAKGAASGLPIGLTIFAEKAIANLDPKLFGSTFGGGPLALRAATEVALRIADGSLLDNVNTVSARLFETAEVGPVARLRGAGLLLGLELEPGVKARDVQRGLLEQGVLVGTSKDPAVVRLTPPLTLAPGRVDVLVEALEGLEVPA